MSVALMITGQGVEPRLVPVAPQKVFTTRWLPGAEHLGLELVTLMATGFDVTIDVRDELLDELERLRAWMATSHGEDSYDLQRLDTLISELRAVQYTPGTEVFLG
jgi:hypothetical protein